jgi:hypothetical protein
MNTAPTAMTSQSQTLKPSSTPSAMVRAMIKVKAATVAQFLTRECDLATPSFPSVDPVEACYSPRTDAGATAVVAREALRPTNRNEPSGAHLGVTLCDHNGPTAVERVRVALATELARHQRQPSATDRALRERPVHETSVDDSGLMPMRSPSRSSADS